MSEFLPGHRGSLRLGSIYEPVLTNYRVGTGSGSLSSSSASPVAKRGFGVDKRAVGSKSIPGNEVYDAVDLKFTKLVPANMREGGVDGILYSPTGTNIQTPNSEEQTFALSAFRFPLMTTDMTEKVEVMSAACRAILIPMPTTPHFATSDETRSNLVQALFDFLNENSEEVESALKSTLRETRDEASRPKQYYTLFLEGREECLEDRQGLYVNDFINEDEELRRKWAAAENELIKAAKPLVDMMPDTARRRSSAASTSAASLRKQSVASNSTRRFQSGLEIRLNFYGSSSIPFEHFYKVTCGTVSKGTTMWGRSEDYRPYGPHRCTGLVTIGDSPDTSRPVTVSLIRRSLVEKGGCCGLFSKVEHDTKLISSFDISLEDVCIGSMWAMKKTFQIPDCPGKVTIEVIVDPSGNPAQTAPDCEDDKNSKSTPNTNKIDTNTDQDQEPTPLLAPGYPNDDASSMVSSATPVNAMPVPVEDTWGVDHVKQLQILMGMIRETTPVAEEILQIYAVHYGVPTGLVDLLIAQQIIEDNKDTEYVNCDLIKSVETRLKTNMKLVEERRIAGEVLKKLRNMLKDRSKELISDSLKRTGSKPEEQLKELKEITKSIQLLVSTAAKLTGVKSKAPKVLYEKWLKEGVKEKVTLFTEKIIGSGVVERRQSMTTSIDITNGSPTHTDGFESEMRKVLSQPAGVSAEGLLVICRMAYDEGVRFYNKESDVFNGSAVQPQDLFSDMDYLKVIQTAVMNEAAEIGMTAAELAAKAETRSPITHAFVHALCKYFMSFIEEPTTPNTPEDSRLEAAPWTSVNFSNPCTSKHLDHFPVSATFSSYYANWASDICSEAAENISNQGVQSVFHTIVEVAGDALLWNNLWEEADELCLWEELVKSFCSAVQKAREYIAEGLSLATTCELVECMEQLKKALSEERFEKVLDITCNDVKEEEAKIAEVLKQALEASVGSKYQSSLAKVARKVPPAAAVVEQKIFKFRKDKAEERQPTDDTISEFTAIIENTLAGLECEAAGNLSPDFYLLVYRSTLSSLLLTLYSPPGYSATNISVADANSFKSEGLVDAITSFFDTRGVKDIHGEAQPYLSLFKLLGSSTDPCVKTLLHSYVTTVFSTPDRFTSKACLPTELEELASITRRKGHRDPVEQI
eukprot:TRINITY_DN3760_c1_g1_i1.p1 TRINITY_DN3760_c1_g1~~TRINITY_DN3760_c1_g1_i1.p1  ORF type:complete len:1148 (+),score=217.37 TRINITY_DN3760_c1_g1_i1:113-3556(+)